MTGSPNGRVSRLVALGDNALLPMASRVLGEHVGVSPDPPLGILWSVLGGRGEQIPSRLDKNGAKNEHGRVDNCWQKMS